MILFIFFLFFLVNDIFPWFSLFAFQEKEFEHHHYTNEVGFMAGLACFHLNMSMYDVEHDEVFGHTFSLKLENDPYLMNDLDNGVFRGRNPMRRTLSWLVSF